ncbi:small, acid-soluble spore protein L [Virgibacillus sp. DJP39]
MNENEFVKKKGRVNTSVNPQGQSEDAASQRPKSDLENKAKKSNTKR